jgi:hypothetical protein
VKLLIENFLRGTADIRHRRRIINEATDLIRTYSSGLTESRNFLTSLAMVEQRSLTLRPDNSLISPKLTLSVGFSTSIALRAVTQASQLSYISSLICDSPARRRLRYSDRSRVIGTQGCEYNDGLHACIESRRTRGAKSGRQLRSRARRSISMIIIYGNNFRLLSDRLVYVRLQGIVLVVKAFNLYVTNHAIQKL